MYALFIVVLICELILTVPIVITTVFYLKEDRLNYKLFGASVGWLLFHLVHETKPDKYDLYCSEYNLEQEKLKKQLNEVLDSVRSQNFSELNTLLSDLPKKCNLQHFKDLVDGGRPRPKEIFLGDWDGSYVPYGRIHTTKKTMPNELNMEED
jgi:hypothetical protein